MQEIRSEDETVKFKVLCAGESVYVLGSFTNVESRISSKVTQRLAYRPEIGNRLPRNYVEISKSRVRCNPGLQTTHGLMNADNTEVVATRVATLTQYLKASHRSQELVISLKSE